MEQEQRACYFYCEKEATPLNEGKQTNNLLQHLVAREHHWCQVALEDHELLSAQEPQECQQDPGNNPSTLT